MINFKANAIIKNQVNSIDYSINSTELKQILNYIENFKNEILIYETIPISIFEFQQNYLAEINGKIPMNTYHSFKSFLNVFANYFGLNRKINTLTLSDFQGFIKSMSFDKKYRTVQVRQVHLCYFLKIFRDKNYISKDFEYEKVKLTKKEVFQPTPTWEEIKLILCKIKRNDIQSAVAGYFMSGMRENELTNLTWENIDFRLGVIILDNKIVTTKNKKPRIIPLIKELKFILLELKKDSSFVFLNDNTREKLNRKTIEREFKAAQQLALGHRNFSIHSLRRGYASWLYEQGIPIQKISKYLGHSSITMTEKYYLQYRLLPDDIEQMQRLNF